MPLDEFGLIAFGGGVGLFGRDDLAQFGIEFLKNGLMLAVDGMDPEELRETVELEVEQMRVRHRQGAAFWQNAAGFAPAFGVAGTVIGLIDMLANLSDPSALGPALAVAFSTTLWGVFLANYVFAPVSNKLKRASAIEVAYRELLVEGILSIQAGANPRSIAGKLSAYLPPGDRPDEEQKSA